jgi:MYXO-CTERM domain-containing protein
MKIRGQLILLSWLASMAAWFAVASPAYAELDACGGIFLSADAGCEYRPKQECMTQCMTVAVEESCVSEVYAGCESECTTTATEDCQNTCTHSCVDSCTTETTTAKAPSCMDLCLSDCQSDDDDACGSATHKGPCGRCQKHNCEKRCQDKCGGSAEQPTKVTTTTECMPTCTDACAASCTAKVNTQCQVDCQERTYTNCEQKMVEQCNTECKDKGGAIFCDGQFVNADNTQSCADELSAKLKINIDIDATLSSVGDSAENAASSVSKKVDKACSVAAVGGDSSQPALGMIASLFGLALWRVRRRRARR